jgi:hypothetical protein
MPYIDYFLTTEQSLTQDKLKKATKPLLTPDLDFGARQWNKKQVAALTLVLCNIVKHGHRDGGVFLYSRKREQVPSRFSPRNKQESAHNGCLAFSYLGARTTMHP